MREDEAGRARVPWRSNPIVARLTNVGAHLSGAVLLAAGVANTLAARRNRNDDGKHHRDRERGDRRDHKDRDQDESRDERQARREDRDLKREQTDDSSADRSDRDRNRDRKNDDTDDAKNDADSDVGAEQNNDNNRNRNRNRDDEPNNDNDDEVGGNNAGSAFFDSPLATKARRRAKDFENQDRDEEGEGRIIADVDPEGESIYQTDSISFATGPDGIEINTGNITYIAAPTPTPTPMPRLELPERDGYPFGEDFPFGVARPEQTPTSTTLEPDDEVPDPGDSPPPPAEPVPTEPLPSDTDGGDNGMEFTS
jgi:hypothetical protein